MPAPWPALLRGASASGRSTVCALRSPDGDAVIVMTANNEARVIRADEGFCASGHSPAFIKPKAIHRPRPPPWQPSRVLMPTAASAALRAAVHAALTADPALISALGGPKNLRRAAARGGISLCHARRNCALRIFPPAASRRLEHQLTLHAWSRQGGHREAHVIAGALLQALDDAPLALAGHRWSISAFQPPTCGAKPTGAPITRWCASAQ